MKRTHDEFVLVAVLKNQRDLEILLREKWYRIPVNFAPKKKFKYLAFYQPLEFGKSGKCIKYYARVSSVETKKRIKLLPEEPNHPRAKDDYLKITVSNIFPLARSIKNVIPRRVIFGYTTVDRLFKARDMLELYDIVASEQILEVALKEAGIKYKSQHWVTCGKRRFRLDLAIFCQKGKIAIECDNKKAHAGSVQLAKDQEKNEQLKKFGWRVLRFSESEITEDLKKCLAKTKQTICRFKQLE